MVAVRKDVVLGYPETQQRSKEDQARQHQVEMSSDQVAP